MAQSKRNTITDGLEVKTEKTEIKEELISLSQAVDRLGIIDQTKFYVMKKYRDEKEKSLSNWTDFFMKLKLI